MYTILLNETNELITSVKERIMQRSKLVDSLHFLVDPIYKGLDMSEFTVMAEILMPVSKEYKTEILVKSDELYKSKLEYKMPFDTSLTQEAGDVQIQLTFVKVDIDANGNPVQQVRKTSPTVITILSIAEWSNIIPDSALTALDQRLVKLDAQMHGISDYLDVINNNKVDNLVYNDVDETLQLSANGVGVGDKLSVRDMLNDGMPVVDLDGSSSDGPNGDTNHNDGCNCGCEDNVVEFGYGPNGNEIPKEPEDEDNVIEF